MKPPSASGKIVLIVGLSSLLFVAAAPMILPFAWQLVHGHEAHIEQTELQLRPGWMVYRDIVVKPPQNILLANTESDLIVMKSIEKCQPPPSASRILAVLKNEERQNGASNASDETLNIGGKIAPCFTIKQDQASARDQTSCVALDGQVVVTILATPESRNEALNMLRTLRETKPCTP
jgi:hypothetical protein